MNGVKSQPAESEPNASKQFVSGKLVIVSIMTVAVVAAGASWWFRYNATHHAAGFWGRKDARLIRSSSGIKLTRENRDNDGRITTSITRDVSTFPGITHLRAALLEDKNFKWPASDAAPSTPIGWYLKFSGDSPSEIARVYFTSDLKTIYHSVSPGRKLRVVSCEPISAGLLEIFTGMIAEPATKAPAPPR